MKGHSRVFVGGWLPVSWSSDRLWDIGSSVQLLLWRPHERGLQDLQLDFFAFQRGRCLDDGGALTLPDLSTGRQDCEVGQACLHSHRLILVKEIIILSGDWASGRHDDGPLVHLQGSILPMRCVRNWSHSTPRRSIVGCGIRRPHHFSTLVERVIAPGNILLRRVLLKVGLFLRDASPEALKILVSKVYLLLHPLS